jgi:ABC-2 type transport system permease protein
VTLATATILVGFGTYLFDFHMVGSYFSFAIVCILGILIFLGVGFSIAGWARDETQAAPIANLIQLPLLLLSGIFFPRTNFPAWLKAITDFSPLTYMSDALRKIANDGQSLLDLPVQMLGMLVWLVIIYSIAVKLFRWE